MICLLYYIFWIHWYLQKDPRNCFIHVHYDLKSRFEYFTICLKCTGESRSSFIISHVWQRAGINLYIIDFILNCSHTPRLNMNGSMTSYQRLKSPVTRLYGERMVQSNNTKNSSCASLTFCERNLAVISGFTSQRTSYAESVSMSWRHLVLLVNMKAQKTGNTGHRPYIVRRIISWRFAISMIELPIFAKTYGFS